MLSGKEVKLTVVFIDEQYSFGVESELKRVHTCSSLPCCRFRTCTAPRVAAVCINLFLGRHRRSPSRQARGVDTRPVGQFGKRPQLKKELDPPSSDRSLSSQNHLANPTPI